LTVQPSCNTPHRQTSPSGARGDSEGASPSLPDAPMELDRSSPYATATWSHLAINTTLTSARRGGQCGLFHPKPRS
jgi:hypothetical protein